MIPAAAIFVRSALAAAMRSHKRGVMAIAYVPGVRRRQKARSAADEHTAGPAPPKPSVFCATPEVAQAPSASVETQRECYLHCSPVTQRSVLGEASDFRCRSTPSSLIASRRRSLRAGFRGTLWSCPASSASRQACSAFVRCGALLWYASHSYACSLKLLRRNGTAQAKRDDSTAVHTVTTAVVTARAAAHGFIYAKVREMASVQCARTLLARSVAETCVATWPANIIFSLVVGIMRRLADGPELLMHARWALHVRQTTVERSSPPRCCPHVGGSGAGGGRGVERESLSRSRRSVQHH